MLILNKKRLSIIILIILFGIFTFSYRTAEQEIQEQQPVTATPVSSKVIILDAGHRSTGRTEPKVQMEQQKRKQT